ncbi:hypothetical protein BG004_005929 [Podila humilis]|nr:hypothetical protein BG004_005929 [Podila humilis]
MADNPAQDSITMAQLKQFVSTLPSKQKLEPVHFQYADMDTVSAEIDEFYGYSEVQQFLENETNFTQHYAAGKNHGKGTYDLEFKNNVLIDRESSSIILELDRLAEKYIV